MEVRAKKALGQHFLTDQRVARAIVDALETGAGICSQTSGHPRPDKREGPTEWEGSAKPTIPKTYTHIILV